MINCNPKSEMKRALFLLVTFLRIDFVQFLRLRLGKDFQVQFFLSAYVFRSMRIDERIPAWNHIENCLLYVVYVYSVYSEHISKKRMACSNIYTSVECECLNLKI